MAFTWEFYVAIFLFVLFILVLLLFIFLLLNPGSNLFDRIKMSLGFSKKSRPKENNGTEKNPLTAPLQKKAE